jgi:PhzF family phenazine biosynthesis protein
MAETTTAADEHSGYPRLVPELLRLTAFTLDPGGGNPAGVWIGSTLPEPDEMQRIASGVGFSETAFLTPDGTGRPGAHRIRYFSPAAEVPFCGHATIAGGVALAERSGLGRFLLTTNDGLVTVDVERGSDGRLRATLTSVEPRVRDAEPELLADALAALRWAHGELDPALPPAVGYAGAYHLILAAAAYDTLRNLSYDFDRLRSIMLAADLTTVQLVWREAPDRFRARDPFPVGNVVEDPATGAAAAAFAGYLRDIGWPHGGAIDIVQGEDMGLRSLIRAEIGETEGSSIRVSGTARFMDDA